MSIRTQEIPAGVNPYFFDEEIRLIVQDILQRLSDVLVDFPPLFDSRDRDDVFLRLREPLADLELHAREELYRQQNLIRRREKRNLPNFIIWQLFVTRYELLTRQAELIYKTLREFLDSRATPKDVNTLGKIVAGFVDAHMKSLIEYQRKVQIDFVLAPKGFKNGIDLRADCFIQPESFDHMARELLKMVDRLADDRVRKAAAEARKLARSQADEEGSERVRRRKTPEPKQPRRLVENKADPNAIEQEKYEYFRIGTLVHSEISRCERGLIIFRRLKFEYVNNRLLWISKLRQEPFSQEEIDAVMSSNTARAAACKVIAAKEKPGLQAIRNYYCIFLKRSRLP